MRVDEVELKYLRVSKISSVSIPEETGKPWYWFFY